MKSGGSCPRDPRRFELLILEGAQAGLSWSTMLNERENYGRAFDRFNPKRVARYDRRQLRPAPQHSLNPNFSTLSSLTITVATKKYQSADRGLRYPGHEDNPVRRTGASESVSSQTDRSCSGAYRRAIALPAM